MSWTTGQLAGWCAGALHGDAGTEISSVSTDTRSLERGALFVAIRGESFDGHGFVGAAADAGASAVLVETVPADCPVPAIQVADSIAGLGALARAHRDAFDGPVVAITGSNGKTTTKEMCAAILEAGGLRVRRTPGNLNNHIGLPLSILGLRADDAALVVELGMNHSGEIDYLAGIAQPDVAAITNVAAAHLGPLGSLEAIALAKGEIFDRLRPDGTAVVNLDDGRVREQSTRFGGRKLGFGRAERAEFRARDESTCGGCARFALDTPAGATSIQFRVPGLHLVDDALCAAAAAWATGRLDTAPLDAIRAGLDGFAGVPGRSGVRSTPSGVRVLDDTYNANPHSVAAALHTLAALRGDGRLVAVLGDMLELGPEENALHAASGRAAADAAVDWLIGVGPLSEHTCRAARDAGVPSVESADDAASVAERLAGKLRPGDTVLVKGSRGMRMERVVNALMESD